MKKFFVAMIILSNTLVAGEVCQKCERIREYNKDNPGEYEFYEDYLKDKEEKAKSQK